MKQIIYSFILILSVMLTSCHATQEIAKTPDGGNPLSFSCKDSTVTAVLIGNATTGYSWSYKIKNEKVLKYVSDEYQTNQADSKMAGVGGKHTFVFKAEAPGTAYVTFTYSQPWKNGKNGGSRILMVMVDSNLNVTAGEAKIGNEK